VSTGSASTADRARCLRARALGAALAAGVALAAAAAHAETTPPPPRADGFVRMLLDLGLGEEAGREARRLVLERGPEALEPETLFRAGTTLALEGRAAEAVPLLIQAADGAADPRLADRWQLAAGVALLRARSFPHATHLFARVEAFGADEATRARATRLRCMGEVLALHGASARACLRELPGGPGARPREVDDLVGELEISEGTRAVVGGVLSGLVPGLGQLTAGHPGDASLALLVNGAWGVGVYLLVADGAFFDAALLGLGVGVRYYLGNINNGAQAWRDAAERRRAAASARLLRLLGGGAGPP
jgi:hypothetical protein